MGNLKLEICKIETLALCKFCSTEEVCWLIVNILLHKHLHHVTLPMRKRMMQCRLQWVQCCSSGEGRACSVITINWLATIISSQLLQHSLRHSLPTLMLTPRCLDTRQGKGHSHYWSSLGFSLDTLNWRRKKTWNSTTGSWQQRDFVGWHLLLGIFLFQISIQLLLLCWDENIIFCRDDTGPMSHTSQVSRSVQFYNLFYSRGLKEILYTTTN